MPTPAKSLFDRIPDGLVLTVIVIAAFSIRIYHIAHLSLWFDETVTFVKSHVDLPSLWISPTENKPPLYYTIVKTFLFLGDSEFILRLPSALAGTISVALGYLIGKTLGGRREGFIISILFLLHDVNIQYSQEARHYIFLIVGLELSIFGLLRLLISRREASNSKRLIVSSTFIISGNIISIYSHTVAIVYLFVIHATIVSYLLFFRDFNRLKPLLAANLISIILGVPWFLTLFQLTIHGDPNFEWLQQPTPSESFELFRGVLGARFSWLPVSITTTLLLLAALLGAAALIRAGQRNIAITLTAGLFATPILLWIVGLETPIYMFRTLAPLHIYSCVLTGSALSRLQSNTARFALTTVIIAIFAKSTVGYEAAFTKTDWRSAIQYAEDQLNADGVIVICQQHRYAPLSYYLSTDIPVLSVGSTNDVSIMTRERHRRAVSMSVSGDTDLDEAYPLLTEEFVKRIGSACVISIGDECGSNTGGLVTIASRLGLDFASGIQHEFSHGSHLRVNCYATLTR